MSWFTRMFKNDTPLPTGATDKNNTACHQGAENTNTDPSAQETDSAVALADDQNDIEQSGANQ